MRVLHRFVSQPVECTYLPGRPSKIEYSIVAALSAQEYEDLMNRGFRKFGRVLFQPVCDVCHECRPIRVPTGEFKPDRSQRRAWKRNQDLRIRTGKPQADAVRLDLYKRYHDAQTSRKGWSPSLVNCDEYISNFIQNTVPATEISIWQGNALLGIILTEITPNVVSAVYHYHDPAIHERGLGTFSILHVIQLARQLQKKWVYLGFFVEGCGSMQYKSRFTPSEIMDVNGAWQRV